MDKCQARPITIRETDLLQDGDGMGTDGMGKWGRDGVSLII